MTDLGDVRTAAYEVEQWRQLRADALRIAEAARGTHLDMVLEEARTAAAEYEDWHRRLEADIRSAAEAGMPLDRIAAAAGMTTLQITQIALR